MNILAISLLILSTSLGLFLSVYIALYRRAPGSQALSVLILGASLWSLGYAFEILATSDKIKLLWEKFEYFGIVIIPLAWFTFVAEYLGNPKWMRRILRNRIFLLAIPIISLVLVWTNDYHHLMWELETAEPVGQFTILAIAHKPWFWILMIYSYTLVLLGSVKLATSLFRIVRLQRWQIILALLAILLPWISNILYITGLEKDYFIDRTAFVFLFSGVLFSISLFRFQLVNIIPIAQGVVFAGLSDGVFVLDLADSIVEMNPAAKAMIGDQADSVLGKKISYALPQLVPYLRKAGFDKEYFNEITFGEGEKQQYYDMHISLLMNRDDVAIGHLIVLHQITQHKRDQAEIEKARDHLEAIVNERTVELRQAFDQLQQELVQRTLAEKRLKDVIESAPDAMFLVDQAGKILLVNAMAELMFGYSKDELQGKSLVEMVIPKKLRNIQGKYFSELLNTSKATLTSFGTDLYAMRRDGSVFPIEVDISRLDTTNSYWMAINVHDISDRKHAEAALRESEQTYRALFENAGDAIILSDLEGHIIQGNQKTIQLLGFNQQEMQSLSLDDITSTEEKSDVKLKMEKLVKGELLLPYLRRYITKSGEVLPTENITVLVKDADGKPKYFQNVVRDISERIRAEHAQSDLLVEIRQSNEQMRNLALRLQEVQESERIEIAAELHDRVGQNLTGLNLNLKILQNQLQSELKPDISQRLEESLVMLEETTHKIRDVMADLNPPVLDEYGLLAAIKWYGDGFGQRTKIATHVNGNKLNPRLPSAVERILFRLVQEALNNVAKHARASRVNIGIKADDHSVSLMIKDNGIGFDPQELKQPTSQPHWGLLSMQQRAASIGAGLFINSIPGKGTQVLIKVGRNLHDDQSSFSR